MPVEFFFRLLESVLYKWVTMKSRVPQHPVHTIMSKNKNKTKTRTCSSIYALCSSASSIKIFRGKCHEIRHFLLIPVSASDYSKQYLTTISVKQNFSPKAVRPSNMEDNIYINTCKINKKLVSYM